MGPMRQATDNTIAALDSPDAYLVAFVQRLADICDGEDHNASYFKEYQAAMRVLCPPAPGPSLNDLVDD